MIYEPPEVCCQWKLSKTCSDSLFRPLCVRITGFRDYYDQLRSEGYILYIGRNNRKRKILWTANGTYDGKFTWLLEVIDLQDREVNKKRRRDITLDLHTRYFLVIKLEQLAKFRRTKPGKIRVFRKANLFKPEKPWARTK